MIRWKSVVPVCVLVAVVAVLVWAGPALAESSGETSGSTALAAIDAAAASGEISSDQALLYKVYYVKGSAKLPTHFEDKSGDRIKCATGVLLEAQERLSTLPAEMQEEIGRLMVRPTNQTYIDTDHYRVHYDTSGSGMIYLWPNTAYRDSVMASCEFSYNFYHVLNSWQIPPSDGTAGGGSGLIDCYVIALNGGIYGYTQAESQAPNWPSDYTAYFVIDNDYTGFGYVDRTLPMKVTVAHEYHHVVQMGYTIGNNWWMENVATFCEDEVYDAIDDNHNYLFLYMNTPYQGLTTFDGGHEYGAFIWPTMIKETYFHDVIRQIYLCSATTTIFTCYNNVFSQFDKTFREINGEWGIWNFYTWYRYDGGHYIEGADYLRVMAYDRQFITYPQTDQHPSASKLPEPTAQSVMRFVKQVGSTDNVLTITFNGPSCVGQVCLIAKVAGQVEFNEYYMSLNASGDGTVDVPDWDLCEYAHMITFMPQGCSGDYIFSAVTTQSSGIENAALYTRTIRLDQNTPNPFGPETSIGYSLERESPVRLSVYDAGGRQVRALIQTSQAPGSYSIRWDGRNDAGDRVPRGIYFYRLNAGADAEVRKMVVTD